MAECKDQGTPDDGKPREPKIQSPFRAKETGTRRVKKQMTPLSFFLSL
jgi:hypothetical protein